MKNNRKPFIIKLGYLTIVTTLFWIAYSAYAAFNKPVDVAIPPESLQTFDPTLDEGALSTLQQSIYLTEEDLTSTIVDIAGSVPAVVIDEPEVIIESEEVPANEES